MTPKIFILLVFVDVPNPPPVVGLWFKAIPRVGECIRVDARNYRVRQLFHLGTAAADKAPSIELLLESPGA